MHRLLAARYRVYPQWEVGAYRIDIVVEGERSRLAVECDGDRFHPIEQLPQDMARQAVLERLGWRFHRIRGSAYFRNPDAAMAKLFAKLAALDIFPGLGETVEPKAPSDLVEEIKRSASVLRQEWAAGKADSDITDQLPEFENGVGELIAGYNSNGNNLAHQAWQLPLAEWRILREQLRNAGDGEALKRIGGVGGHDYAHKVKVMEAIQRGEVVSARVLVDYPDLQGRN